MTVGYFGTYLPCVAVFVGVRDAPVITCSSSSAFIGDRNTFLRCDIKARPWVSALYWILDLNGTTIGKAESVSDYWTKVTVFTIFAVAPLFENSEMTYIVSSGALNSTHSLTHVSIVV